MKALLSISLVLAIIAPGEPLRCNTCGGQVFHPTSCQKQTSRPCNSSQTMCMSGVMRTNMIIYKTTNIKYASCQEPEDVVTGDYSLTSANNKYFQYMADSCDTDNCNPIPKVPNHKELPLNGLQCPACFVNGTGVCASSNIVNCHQNEKKCIDFAGTLITGVSGSNNVTVKGCATEEFCRLERGSNRLVKNMLIVKVFQSKCIDAQESLSELSPEE